jgi:hypothetical protein
MSRGIIMAEKFKNHWNKTFIIVFSTISLLGFIISFLWIYIEDGFDWFGIIVCIAVSLAVFFSTVILIEVIQRPKEIEVTDDGITLIYQTWRRKRYVPWVQIDKLNHGSIKQSEVTWTSVDSGLFVKGMKGYALINWQIAEVIRERYKSHIGVYPHDDAIEMERTNR